MEFNLADLFEQAVDHFGPRECLVANGVRRTLRARWRSAPTGSRITSRAHGVRPGRSRRHLRPELRRVGRDAVGRLQDPRRVGQHQLPLRRGRAALPRRQRGPEGARLRAPVRAARRRGARRHADLVHAIVIEDGSGEPLAGIDAIDFEAAMADGSPDRDFAPRSGDDRYILYTGGTTGLPKGVLWRHEDVFFALGGGIDAASGCEGAAARGHDRARRCAGSAQLLLDRAADARRHAVVGDEPLLRRQQERAGREVRPGRSVATRRSRSRCRR